MAQGYELIVSSAAAKAVFDVIPEEYATYCSLVSQVLAHTLQRFEVTARLQSCQLWHAAPRENHVVGFLGNPPRGDKWDGHVVCRTRSFLLDGAVRNLQRDFNLRVPKVAVAAAFNAPSHVIARLDLDKDRTLWWHDAPAGFDTQPPRQPIAIIDHFVRDLVAKVDEVMRRAPLLS